jgi:hypothetical protein
MSWADTIKKTALTGLAERTATGSRMSGSTPWDWNTHDVWLKRVKQPRARTARSSIGQQYWPPPTHN